MGTRSVIARTDQDWQIEAVYCHWDGYLEHNGRILDAHYTTDEKVRELISLGDISSLGPEIGTKHDFDKRPEGETNFYGRDRGEEGTEATALDGVEALKQFAKECGAEFAYLWTGKAWLYSADPEYSPFEKYKNLSNALAHTPSPA